MRTTEQPQRNPILGHTYDLSSCGLGVQRSVVAALIPDPLLANIRELLRGNVGHGPGSNLLSHYNFSPEYFESAEIINKFTERLALLNRDWSTVHRRALRLLAGFNEISAKDLSEKEFEIVAKVILNSQNIEQRTLAELFRSRDDYLFRAFIAVASDDRLTWLGETYKAALLSTELRREMIKFQARKLKLMADISAHCLREDGALTGNEIPESVSGSTKDNWRKYLGEELPPLGDLIAGSREIYLKAAKIVRQGVPGE